MLSKQRKWLQPTYYPINVLRNTIHMTHLNSYMFRHRGAIFMGILYRKRTNQLTSTCFVRSCTHNLDVRLLKYIKMFKTHTIDNNDSLQYPDVL